MKVPRVLEYEVRKKNWLVFENTDLNLIRLAQSLANC